MHYSAGPVEVEFVTPSAYANI